MVWLNPSNHLQPLNLVGGMLWKTIQENDYFQLQQNKISSKLSAGTLLGDAVSSLRALNPFDQGGAQYRILLKAGSTDGVSHVAAVVADSNRLDTIVKHWSILEDELLPKLRTLPPNVNPRVFLIAGITKYSEDQNNHNNNNNHNTSSTTTPTSTPLSVPTSTPIPTPTPTGSSSISHSPSLSQSPSSLSASPLTNSRSIEDFIEGEDNSDNPEIVILNFQKYFPEDAKNEQLITYYYALLGKKLLKGILFVTERGLYFYSENKATLMGLRVKELWEKIPFNSITSISKTSVFLTITATEPQRQYQFLFVSREKVYALLYQLWKLTFEQLRLKENGPRVTKSAENSSQGTSEHMVMENSKVESFRLRFRLPSDQKLQAERWCMMQSKASSLLAGTLYIATNFLCFASHTKKNTWVTIPLMKVRTLNLSKQKIGLNAIVVETRDNKFEFVFAYGSDQLFEVIKDSCRKNAMLADPSTSPLCKIPVTEDLPSSWQTYFKDYGSDCTLVKTQELLHLIRKGIPDSIRGKVWQVCSGSVHRLELCRGYYTKLHTLGEQNPSLIAEIEIDLARSSDKPIFKTAEGQASLRRVLLAYGQRNPDIGYCQGMNIVVATFLLYMDEEESFWLLVSLCESLLPNYYKADLSGSVIDQAVFSFLVYYYIPDVKEHLEKYQLSLDMFCFPWMLVLFIGYIPEEAYLRVLDSFFFEGVNSLFKTALAMLKIAKSTILQATESTDVISALKEQLYEPDALIELAFNVYDLLPQEKMYEIRMQEQVKSVKALRDMKKKRALYHIQANPKLTKQHLEKLYDLFEESSTSEGKENGINFDNFLILFFKYIPGFSKTTYNMTLLRSIFQSLDADSDKELVFAEVVNFLDLFLGASALRKLKCALKLVVASDNNGLITTEELTKCFTIMYIMTNSSAPPKYEVIQDLVQVVYYKAQLIEDSKSATESTSTNTSATPNTSPRECLFPTRINEISLQTLDDLMQNEEFLETFWSSFVPPNQTNQNQSPALQPPNTSVDWILV